MHKQFVVRRFFLNFVLLLRYSIFNLNTQRARSHATDTNVLIELFFYFVLGLLFAFRARCSFR